MTLNQQHEIRNGIGVIYHVCKRARNRKSLNDQEFSLICTKLLRMEKVLKENEGRFGKILRKILLKLKIRRYEWK